MNNHYYLIRHGENEDNAKGILTGQRDEPLTAKGIRQVYEAAQEMKEKDITFDVVLASPLDRTVKTAEIICEILGIAPPLKEDLLIERNFGVMAGEPVPSIIEKCAPDVIRGPKDNYFLHAEGAETFPDLLERARQLFKNLDRVYENKTFLLSTHGEMGRMIYAQYRHEDWREVLRTLHIGNAKLITL